MTDSEKLAREQKEKTLAHFEETAKNYDDSMDGRFVQPMYKALIDSIKKAAPESLLDIGCGTGNVLRLLAGGKTRLYGVDFSKEMIAQAKTQLGQNAELAVGDAEALPYAADSFDALVCNASFHHYPHPDAVLAQMRKVAKNGALLFMGEGYIPQPARFFMNIFIRYSDAGDCRCYGKTEMTKLLGCAGFAVQSIKKSGPHAVLYIARLQK